MNQYSKTNEGELMDFIDRREVDLKLLAYDDGSREAGIMLELVKAAQGELEAVKARLDKLEGNAHSHSHSLRHTLKELNDKSHTYQDGEE